ncbi:MAG: endonuclease III domain-containing protein [Anaerolineae bacterium]
MSTRDSSTADMALAELAAEVDRRLMAQYGEPGPAPSLDPVSQIVSTILSQNTNDANRDRAYQRLRERFPTWEEVLLAPVGAIEEAIRPAGLAPQRAPRIKAALQHIYEQRGTLELDFLRQWPVEEAKRWLMGIHGVGPKTASIVLLFSLGMPAFPVDTHVHRVTRRLGLAPARASAEKVQHIIEGLIPPARYYPFHINVIRHGRQICAARRPACEKCFLPDICAYYRARNSLSPP